MGRERRYRRWLYSSPLIAAALAAAAMSALGSSGISQRHYYFGTLLTDPSKARLEHANGIRVAYLGVHWDKYEPSKGVYDRRYVASVRKKLRMLRRAGAMVELGAGLNHPPRWLFRDYPETAYVDQYHDVYTGSANLVFSELARHQAQRYLSRLQHDIGLKNFWAIRVGVDSNGEFIYPPADAAGDHNDDYWAFDLNAQGPASHSRRPPTVPPNPFSGWRPGDRAYRGRPFSVAQVTRWYDWYLRALSDAVNWQLRYYRSLGYKGYLKVLVPGTGYFPSTYHSALNRHLDGTTAPELLAVGAGFFRTLAFIRPRRNVEVVSTSLVDGSGQPRNNGCSRSDRKVRILARNVTSKIYDWSSVRWIANVARREGFALLNGESAGPQVAPYYPGVTNDAARQMASCGLQGLMWAFDGNLYDGTPGSSLRDYASVIRRYDR